MIEAYYRPLEIGSTLDAPILRHGKVVGVVCHEYIGSHRKWSLEEQEFVTAIATTVALSLEIKKRKKIEKALEHQAYHDTLTDLPNRTLFLDRLDQAIFQAERHGDQLAVLFIDLDRFKQINDSLGHAVGDDVLRKVAGRLQMGMRQVDTIARLGGDEFTVLISDLEKPQYAAAVARKIINAFSSALDIGGNQFYITTSIGISLYPQDGTIASELLKNADVAMYQAKDNGRNTFEYYSQRMSELAFERILMETHLRHAIEQEQFFLHYQPQCDLHSGTISGMEVLLRWNHPELGMVAPTTFILLAEETGLIIPIGEWVLENACKQAAAWYSKGYVPGRIAVNLSGKQIAMDSLFPTVERILKTTGCSPHWLELEVTESFIMKEPELAIANLSKLKALGIELSIDDFGTGYSSLAYLKRLPISKLKIDRSFVRDIYEDDDDKAIVRAIIALGKSLGLKTIAEGLETQQQRDLLVEEGCNEIQGFFFSHPLSVDEAEALLAEWNDNEG